MLSAEMCVIDRTRLTLALWGGVARYGPWTVRNRVTWMCITAGPGKALTNRFIHMEVGPFTTVSPPMRLFMVASCLAFWPAVCRADNSPSFSLFAKIATPMSSSVNKLTTESAAGAAGTLSEFPGDQPSVKDLLDWLRESKPKLSADERALIAGYVPRVIQQYMLDTMPPPLVEGVAGAAASMVAARDVVRTTIADANARRDALRVTAMADLKEGIFNKLKGAMLSAAPLLLADLD